MSKDNKQTNAIAIIFDDLTEFHVMQPAIDYMKKAGIDIDIIVPYDSGYNGLPEHTFQKIKELGYKPLNDVKKDKQYKILLTPYPGLEIVKRINFIYHLRYPYGALSAKPNPTYLPDCRIDYDGIFSFNTYDTDYLNAYGAKVYPIPYWRYHNFKHSRKDTTKPVLLLLPTFGSDVSYINLLTDSIVSKLKEKYYIIAKAHHAVHFGIDGQETLDKLQSIADEFYNSDTPIDQLLAKSDLVLSDNSGAIFESIRAGVPVALFAQNLNQRHLGPMNTPQFTFAQQGFIPHTDQLDKVIEMLSSINKYKAKQSQLKKQLFIKNPSQPIKPFLNIINFYLNSDPTKDHHKILHDLLVKEWRTDKEKIQHSEKQLKILTQYIDDLHNSTSWKITKPIRIIKDKWEKHVPK